MKIIHRDTLLRTITINDIEQLRQWRNNDAVNAYLKSRNFIDKEGQLRWFNSLEPASSIYFMMEERFVPLGVIYAHNINLQDRSFEGNIFTGNTDYLNTHLPVKSTMMLSVLFFDYLFFEQMFSTTHYKNSAAVELDKRMGFKNIKREGDFIFSRCLKDDFESYATLLKKSLLRNIPLEIILEDGDDKYPFLKNR